MEDFSRLQQEYWQLLNSYGHQEANLDYTILDSHSPFLESLARINNSGVTVFDLYKKEHVFASYNFDVLFGYDLQKIEDEGNPYFDSRIHPEDFPVLMQRGLEMLKFYAAAPASSRDHYKLVNEYRILNGKEQFIRVIEQHQLLETDAEGKPWLSLSVLDISPEQGEFQGVKSSVFNFKTGELLHLQNETATNPQSPLEDLTPREKEVLSMIRDGLLSKEISDQLSISVHTVNTHRQRILVKMDAGNSMEAVQKAAKYGII